MRRSQHNNRKRKNQRCSLTVSSSDGLASPTEDKLLGEGHLSNRDSSEATPLPESQTEASSSHHTLSGTCSRAAEHLFDLPDLLRDIADTTEPLRYCHCRDRVTQTCPETYTLSQEEETALSTCNCKSGLTHTKYPPAIVSDMYEVTRALHHTLAGQLKCTTQQITNTDPSSSKTHLTYKSTLHNDEDNSELIIGEVSNTPELAFRSLQNITQKLREAIASMPLSPRCRRLQLRTLQKRFRKALEMSERGGVDVLRVDYSGPL